MPRPTARRCSPLAALLGPSTGPSPRCVSSLIEVSLNLCLDLGLGLGRSVRPRRRIPSAPSPSRHVADRWPGVDPAACLPLHARCLCLCQRSAVSPRHDTHVAHCPLHASRDRHFAISKRVCFPRLRLVTRSLCAMRRLTASLTQSGTTQKEVVESLDSPGAERQRGQQQVENATTLSRGTAERAGVARLARYGKSYTARSPIPRRSS